LQYCASAAPSTTANHAGHGPRLAELELPDPRVGVRAAEEHHVRQARQPQIVHERARPCQQSQALGRGTLLPM